MQNKRLDGIVLSEAFESGYRNLKKNTETVNGLNVFPVPDGDTGTNMVKTFGGGLRAVTPVAHVGEYTAALSRAVLLSARGNSGVIFSQFIHGLARGFEGKDTVVFSDLVRAFECAKEDAYRSIMTPTEGTILTLIRECSDYLRKNRDSFADWSDGITAAVRCQKRSLDKTPDLLPVLREANVVDSGGAGLVCFFEGIRAYFLGEDIEDTPDLADTLSQPAAGSFGPDSVLEYGYCTEFILQLMNAKTDIAAFDINEFVKPLEALGDSIVAVESDGIVKIHVHSFTPEKVLEYGRRFGEFVTIKIENMSVQHSEVQEAKREPEREHMKYAVIAVASGKGIIDYFYSIGATVVIDGGQTSNPSVDSFIEAVNSVDADHYILLPDNSNIVLTAFQARDIMGDLDVRVIPTRSVVEGYSALSMMNLWSDTADELVSDMSSCLDTITTGLVTTAIRDTVMGGLDVKKGDFIGLANKEMIASGAERNEVALSLIKTVTTREEKEVIIVFYGQGVSDEEANELKNTLESAYPLYDIGVIDGGQDVYDYIISLE